ncbi:MAG: hypothetical protein ACEQSL_01730 [Sediminibacterium sp.]
MKTLILMIVCALLTSYSAQAQRAKKELTSGDYLIKAGNQGIGAIVVGLVGGLAGGAIAIAQPQMGVAGAAIGGTCGLIALALEISSYSNLVNAGKMMKSKNIGLLMNENGVGLKFALRGR